MLKKVYYLSYDFGFLSIHSREIIENMVVSGALTELFIPKDAEFLFQLNNKCIINKVPSVFDKIIFKSIFFQIALCLTLFTKIITEERIDLIYARQNYLGIFPAILSRIFRIPYFAEVNGIVSSKFGNAVNTKNIFKSKLEKLTLSLANIIIVPSDTLKYRIFDLLKISTNKVYTVPNGVNTDIFNPNDRMNNIREKLNIQKKDFVVGYVGSLGTGQGIGTLKAAIKNALHNDHRIKFLIVGDYVKDSNINKLKIGVAGEGKKIAQYILKKKLSDRVIYQTYVPYEESADYIKICDILVAPYSNYQIRFGGGSPMKLYAYLGCAKPVIMSDLGDFTDSEIFKKNDAVYFIPPDNGTALSDAIIKLKNDNSLRKSLSKNGLKIVKSHRKWADSYHKILSIYNNQFRKA